MHFFVLGCVVHCFRGTFTLFCQLDSKQKSKNYFSKQV